MRPQRVQCSVHDRRRRLLIIEDGERAGAYDGEEERQCLEPARVGGGELGEGAVGATVHEGAGSGVWGSDQGSMGVSFGTRVAKMPDWDAGTEEELCWESGAHPEPWRRVMAR